MQRPVVGIGKRGTAATPRSISTRSANESTLESSLSPLMGSARLSHSLRKGQFGHSRRQVWDVREVIMSPVGDAVGEASSSIA
jgi:hypothetical protein